MREGAISSKNAIRCARVLVLAALATVAAVAPAGGAEPGPAAVAAVARGDYASAIRTLTELESNDRALFRANNYDYLLGRVLEHRGDLAGAVARYTGVLERDSNLSEYALFRLAGIARLEGNLPLERQYLTRFVSRYPASLLHRQAVTLLARSAFASGDYRSAIQRLQPIAGTRGTTARDALAKVALARLRLGERASARADFERLLAGSQDDRALDAVRGLDELDAADRASVGEVDHVRRGRVYLVNRDWLGARAHFRAVADGAPNSPNRVEALYALGMTAYRLNEPDAAIDWWEKAAREFPSNPTGIRAFYWVGHAHQRAGRYAQAVSRYDDFIRRYPTDDQVEGAYRNAIDSLRSGGDTKNALAWCDRAEAAKPRSALATFAAFNRAKTFLASGNNAGALAELTRLKSSNLRAEGPGMPSPGEVDILRGACLERLGRATEAIALYLTLTPGRDNYFGNRATLRLMGLGKRPEGRAEIARLLESSVASARAARRAGNAAAAKAAADRALRLGEDPALRRELLDILRTSYAALPAYARVATQSPVPVARAAVGGRPGPADRSHGGLGAELAFLGLFDEAAPELEASGLGTRSAYSMAIYNNRGGRSHGAIALGESLVGSLPRDFRAELLPRDVAELIYPAPYRDALRKFALPLEVDPRFELAIARQESGFRPWVKSPAAARGLVQFIPETAGRIATALGIQQFENDDLYDPSVAIRFGGRYLADLFALFPSNPYAVAASYNGGEDAVARWLRRAPSQDDPDLFVAEVGYKESKDYVFRVMNNYWVYQALYTRELNPQ